MMYIQFIIRIDHDDVSNTSMSFPTDISIMIFVFNSHPSNMTVFTLIDKSLLYHIGIEDHILVQTLWRESRHQYLL